MLHSPLGDPAANDKEDPRVREICCGAVLEIDRARDAKTELQEGCAESPGAREKLQKGRLGSKMPGATTASETNLLKSCASAFWGWHLERKRIVRLRTTAGGGGGWLW